MTSKPIDQLFSELTARPISGERKSATIELGTSQPRGKQQNGRSVHRGTAVEKRMRTRTKERSNSLSKKVKDL